MRRMLLKSTIQRATVTATDPDAGGGLTIDRDLMDEADIRPYEQVQVWGASGALMITHAVPGDRGSGEVRAAGFAGVVKPGDIVTVATFAEYREKAARRHEPVVVFVDANNRVREMKDIV